MQSGNHYDLITSLALPDPIDAVIFGVRVKLHIPHSVFQSLIGQLGSNYQSKSYAALSEWLPNFSVPVSYNQLFRQAYSFIKSHNDCPQYNDDATVFLSNAFPLFDIVLILDIYQSKDCNLFETCLQINEMGNHIIPSPDAPIVEIINPYASHQIRNLLPFDDHGQILSAQSGRAPIFQPLPAYPTFNNPNNENSPILQNNSIYPPVPLDLINQYSSANATRPISINVHTRAETDDEMAARLSREDAFPPPRANENDDEAIARILQQEMDEEENRQRLNAAKRDEEYARNIQKQLEEEEKRRRSNIAQRDAEIARNFQMQFDQTALEEKRRREEEENLEECPCCCCEYPFEEMAHCSEGHLCCKNCIKASIESALGEGAVRKTCVCPLENGEQCTANYTNNELMRVLEPALLQRLDQTEAQNNLAQCKIQGLRSCWKCGNKIIDESEINPFYCPCGEETCKQCGKKWHQGQPCDNNPNRYVEEKMSEAYLRRCPNQSCGTQFIKDEGCNHMTCPRCKTEFCFVCGEIITGRVSAHYSNKNGCQQFMDNKKYNEAQIAKAQQDARRQMGMKS